MRVGSPATAACLALPVLAAAAVYAGTLAHEFVFDDHAQIVFNPWVRELGNFPEAVTRPVWAFKVNYPTNYFRPFQMGAYNLLWAASGGRPWAFHAINLVLHAVATAALTLLVLRLSRERLVAFGAGLLFAIHPIHSEAVAWIACLPELGLAVGCLGALLLHVESWRVEARRAWALRAAACACGGLALASKETAVVLPALIAAVEVLCGPEGASGRWTRAARRAAPCAALVALYLVVRRIVVGGVAYAQGGATPWEAALTAPRLALEYLLKIAWPDPLQAYYVLEPVRSIASAGFLGPLAAIAACAAITWWAVWRRADLAFAATLAVVPLLPALAAPAVAVTFFSERYAYLPSAGAVWLAAAAIAAATSRLPRGRAVALAVLIAIALAGTLVTTRRNRVWATNGTLAEATLAREPGARPMWSLLATWHGAAGRAEQALETYHRALERFPGDVGFEIEELHARFVLRRISADELVRELEQRILRDGTIYEAYLYLGQAHARAGNPAAAELAFRNAIRLNPSFKPAYDGLTAALLAQGVLDAAERGLGRASGFALDTLEDRLLESAAHLRAGRPERAEQVLLAALAADPRSPRVLVALAVVASSRENQPAAIDYCRRALDADPRFVEAYQQLGVSALKAGDAAAAVAALETAVGLDPNDKEIYNRLGAAYAAAGRPADARRAWGEALRIDPLFEKARRNLERLDARAP